MAHDYQQDVQAWLDYACMDYDAALTLSEHYPQPFEIICYHCQQAAEKAIKALFIFYKVPGGIPRKHDLSFLLNQIRNVAEISAEIRRCADALSVYGIISRYPNEIQVDERHADRALRYAKTVLEWAENTAVKHPL